MLIPNSRVIFDPGRPVNGYPFEQGEMLLYLGDIADMPGHVIVVNRKGRVFWGYHAESFRPPTEEES